MQELFDAVRQWSMSSFGIRLSVFFLLVLIFIGAESLWPKRKRLYARVRRWGTNFGILAVDILVTTGMQSLAGATIAYYAAAHGWGLLNLLALPSWLAFVITLVALDLAIYGQHVASHKIPLLWRLHRVHHADPDLDVSSALRFHPGEIGLSVLYKGAIVLLLGADPGATVVFAVILNGGAMFNHANWALPLRLDAILRWLIVTPDVHRIHHSNRPIETDSNYGFNLSLWDRLFGTFRNQPKDGHHGMTIGLDTCDGAESVRLLPMLWLPFRKSQRKRDA